MAWESGGAGRDCEVLIGVGALDSCAHEKAWVKRAGTCIRNDSIHDTVIAITCYHGCGSDGLHLARSRLIMVRDL